MTLSFKNYIDYKAKEDFLEEQFTQHLYDRAISEMEWSFPEEYKEYLKEEELFEQKLRDIPVSVEKKVEHRSNMPGYDKRTAYATYGSPVEDTKATTAAIEAHTQKHGKPPSVQKIKNDLKVYVHNTDPKTAGGTTGLTDLYGKADDKPISHPELQSEVGKNFGEFTDKLLKDPKGYAADVTAAKTRWKSKRLPMPLGGNTKTDTVTQIRHPDAPNGTRSSGMTGNPDMARHYTDTSGSKVETNACHGKGSCVNQCLSKAGCGGFESTKGHRDISDQTSTHNSAARRDHQLLLHNQTYRTAKIAKKAGQRSLIRPDVNTGHQAYVYGPAIGKHFGADSELVKSGHVARTIVGTYGKTHGTQYDTHDMSHGDRNLTLSDQGIPVSKGAIAAHQRLTDAIRQRGAPNSRIAYTAIGVNRPDNYERGGKHTDPQKAADFEKAINVKRVRRYDLHPTAPKAGELSTYHDEKTKSGRVEHGGKSYYYTDHETPRPMETVSGKLLPSHHHDDRHGELERHHTENPNDHGINAVSTATTATNLSNMEYGKSIFHPPHNIDNSNILHVMHPASPEATRAREIMGKDTGK